MSQIDDLKVAAEFWNARATQAQSVSIRWWQSKQVLRHLNKKLCGEPLEGFAAGMRRWLKNEIAGDTLSRAISVGCGSGGKELWYIQDNLVGRFDLFEISEKRVKVGIEKARLAGLSERLNFYVADAFSTAAEDTYDMVHWDNSLHHMMDVPAAVDWCWRVLKPGGYLVIHDYVGADRFQFSDRNLTYASKLRRSLPKDFLVNGSKPETFVSTEISRVNAERLKAIDPTEAADSSRIISSVSNRFPNGRWIMLGGAIYHIGLNDLFWNFERMNAHLLLESCLVLDDALSELGENHYASFIGRKV